MWANVRPSTRLTGVWGGEGLQTNQHICPPELFPTPHLKSNREKMPLLVPPNTHTHACAHARTHTQAVGWGIPLGRPHPRAPLQLGPSSRPHTWLQALIRLGLAQTFQAALSASVYDDDCYRASQGCSRGPSICSAKFLYFSSKQPGQRQGCVVFPQLPPPVPSSNRMQR